MFKIKYTRESKNNLGDIFHYIAADNIISAVNVLQKIHTTISQIKLFPYIWKNRNGKMREFVETKYRFRIIYHIDEEEEIIYIDSIFKNKNTY